MKNNRRPSQVPPQLDKGNQIYSSFLKGQINDLVIPTAQRLRVTGSEVKLAGINVKEKQKFQPLLIISPNSQHKRNRTQLSHNQGYVINKSRSQTPQNPKIFYEDQIVQNQDDNQARIRDSFISKSFLFASTSRGGSNASQISVVRDKQRANSQFKFRKKSAQMNPPYTGSQPTINYSQQRYSSATPIIERIEIENIDVKQVNSSSESFNLNDNLFKRSKSAIQGNMGLVRRKLTILNQKLENGSVINLDLPISSKIEPKQRCRSNIMQRGALGPARKVQNKKLMLKYIEKNQGQFSKQNISNIINLDKIYSQVKERTTKMRLKDMEEKKKKKAKRAASPPKQDTQKMIEEYFEKNQDVFLKMLENKLKLQINQNQLNMGTMGSYDKQKQNQFSFSYNMTPMSMRSMGLGESDEAQSEKHQIIEDISIAQESKSQAHNGRLDIQTGQKYTSVLSPLRATDEHDFVYEVQRGSNYQKQKAKSPPTPNR